MSKRNHLTEEQKLFIKSNRLTMSMIDMAKNIGLSYNKVRNYMIENDLALTNSQVQKIRLKKQGFTPGKVEPSGCKSKHGWWEDAYNN